MRNNAKKDVVINKRFLSLTISALLFCATTATAQPPQRSSEELLPPPREELPLPRKSMSMEQPELPPGPTVLPPLQAAPTAPVPNAKPVLLRAGDKVTLRVCQMLPAGHFTPAERLLNSKPPIQVGDHFLAEVIDPLPPHPVLVGGVITKITKPGWFGHPGYLTFRLMQLVENVQCPSGGVVPWQLDLADRRITSKMRHALLTFLLTVDGVAEGASIGSQFSSGNMAFIGGGMGIGLLAGLGYAAFQRGHNANMEPGDTFKIEVGTAYYRPVSKEWETKLYPAKDAERGRGKRWKK